MAVPQRSARSSQLSPLQNLGLHGSDIGVFGTTALGLHLAALSSSQTLNLSDSRTSDDGAATLDPHPAGLSSTRNLSLCCNSIGNDRAVALSPHLSALLSIFRLLLRSFSECVSLCVLVLACQLGGRSLYRLL